MAKISRDSNESFLGGVFILSVASFRSHQEPSVILNLLDEFPDLHSSIIVLKTILTKCPHNARVNRRTAAAERKRGGEDASGWTRS